MILIRHKANIYYTSAFNLKGENMKHIILGLLACSIIAFGADKTVVIPDIPNPPTKYPEGVLGEYVKLGEEVINQTNTHPLSKDLVGNSLTCKNCHINSGKTKNLGTFIGTSTTFPAFSKRQGTIQTLEDRINNCFMRSLNGTRPINGTKLSLVMASYIAWLSEGLPQKMNSKNTVTPFYKDLWPIKEAAEIIKKATHKNYLNGKVLYEQKCAACHQKNGQGIGSVFPPLWGEQSYNSGAGMSKLDKMTTWVMYNMPQGQEGTLSLQEAVDITIYVDAQTRPAFDLKKHIPKNIGHYNSLIFDEFSDTKSNFKAFGLDLDTIKGK